MKVILLTGVSSGFGRATALALAAQGHRVYGVSRRTPDPQLSAALAGHIQADLTLPQSAQEAAERVRAAEGRIDVLINNAGAGIGGALEEVDPQALEQLFQLNFFAMARACRAVLPAMRSQGSGLIINFSSLGGVAGLPYQGAYSATKFAVEGYTESLFNEVKPFGIHVCMVEPGDFATGFTGSRAMATRPDSPYRAYHEKALKRIETDERGGAPAAVLAKKITQIVSARRPRLRYSVGGLGQRILVKSRHIMGDRLFVWLLGKYYLG